MVAGVGTICRSYPRARVPRTVNWHELLTLPCQAEPYELRNGDALAAEGRRQRPGHRRGSRDQQWRRRVAETECHGVAIFTSAAATGGFQMTPAMLTSNGADAISRQAATARNTFARLGDHWTILSAARARDRRAPRTAAAMAGGALHSPHLVVVGSQARAPLAINDAGPNGRQNKGGVSGQKGSCACVAKFYKP